MKKSGKLLLLLTTISFTCLSKAQTNEFKIGIFGGDWCKSDPNTYPEEWYEIPTLVSGNNTYNTSVLNVLTEDGFNIVATYRPNNFTTVLKMKNFLNLSRQPAFNGLELELGLLNYFKPDVDVNNDFLGTGSEVYDLCNNPPIPEWESPFQNNMLRPHYNDLFDNVYSQTPYKDNIWGYHISEESSFDHWNQFNNSCLGGDYGNSSHSVNVEVPPINVSNHLNYVETYPGLGPDKKMVLMEAFHGRSINENTDDLEGAYNHNPQDYIYLLNKKNETHVFFEGSYLAFNESDWHLSSYSNITNNLWHYMGSFKSIDFAQRYASQVHKVMNISIQDDEGNYKTNSETNLHSNTSIANANWMWFKAFTSIIHGVDGVWFWRLGGSIHPDNEDVWTTNHIDNTPDVFEREKFPLLYQQFVSHLARQITYLKDNNFISTDHNTILYTKTDHEDGNCIVGSPATYINSSHILNASEWSKVNDNGRIADHQTENYGLRYTIRTNGTEVIMIVTNPLNVSIKNVDLNFSSVGNNAIANSTGVQVLFENNQYAVDNSNYKTTRTSTNLQSGLIDDQYTVNYNSGTKTITMDFGPMDTKILKFNTSQPAVNTSNEWIKQWSNGGVEVFNGWTIRDGDKYYAVDHDGDGDEELLCVNGNWITMFEFNTASNDWYEVWSNGGGSHGMNPYINNLIVGDFDGDGDDDILGNLPGGYTTMFSFINGTWTWVWSDYGNSSHTMYTYKSQLLAGDYDGDGKDEILGNNLNSGGWMTLFEFDPNAGTNGDFVWGCWSTYGSTGGIYNYRNNLTVGDFDGNGTDDLLGMNGNWATKFNFLCSNGWTWGWSNLGGPLLGFSLPLAPTDFILSGDIDDNDADDEIFLLESGTGVNAASGHQSGNQWSPITKYWDELGYINDWSIADAGGSNTKYLLIKATSAKESLFAVRKTSCNGFVAGLYTTNNTNNFRQAEDEGKGSIVENEVSDVVIYPNPTNNAITVANNNNEFFEVEILDQLGRIVEYKSGKGKVTIDLSNVSEGIYLAKIKLENKIEVKKVIKK